MGTWGDIGDVLLAGLSPSMYGAIQKIRDREKLQEAQPTLSALADFNARGWSSDPSFSGSEWTQGLLDTTGVKPDMTNPNVLQAVTGFANQAQTEKSYADQLQRMGRPVQEAASLSRFALNPAITPHLKTLEAAPDIFSPGSTQLPLDERKFAREQTQEAANREALSNMDYITREETPEGALNALAQVVDVTKASPDFATKELAPRVLSQFSTAKDKAETINPFATFYRGFAAKHPELKGGDLDSAASAAWQAQQERLMLSRYPTQMPVPGVQPGITVDRRSGKWKNAEGRVLTTEELKGMGIEYKTDVIAGTAEATADKASLQNITKGMDTINSFEKGVQQSLTLVDNLSTNFKRSPIPGVNKFSMWLQYNSGNPNVKALVNAVTTACTEYMKVTTAGTGISAAELTQGAQQRAKEIIAAADNPQSIKKSISVMRQEMAIKKKAFNDQRAEIQNRLKGVRQGSGGQPKKIGKYTVTVSED